MYGWTSGELHFYKRFICSKFSFFQQKWNWNDILIYNFLDDNDQDESVRTPAGSFIINLIQHFFQVKIVEIDINFRININALNPTTNIPMQK